MAQVVGAHQQAAQPSDNLFGRPLLGTQSSMGIRANQPEAVIRDADLESRRSKNVIPKRNPFPGGQSAVEGFACRACFLSFVFADSKARIALCPTRRFGCYPTIWSLYRPSSPIRFRPRFMAMCSEGSSPAAASARPAAIPMVVMRLCRTARELKGLFAFVANRCSVATRFCPAAYWVHYAGSE